MFKSIFNKHLSRIVDASWSCIGQEDELIDLSEFSPTLFPAILWLSAVSYGVRSSNIVIVSQNSPFALAFLDCSGLTTESHAKTLGSRGIYCLKARRKSNKLFSEPSVRVSFAVHHGCSPCRQNKPGYWKCTLATASVVLQESIFSFVPSKYLFLISIDATVWKLNGAKFTCQMWVIGKAKLNSGSSPFCRRAVSAWCFWLL